MDVDGHLEMTDHVPVSARDDGWSDPGKPATQRDGEGVLGEEDGSALVVDLVADAEEVDLAGAFVCLAGVEGLVGEGLEGFDGGVGGFAEGAVASAGEEEDGGGGVEDVTVYLVSELQGEVEEG